MSDAPSTDLAAQMPGLSVHWRYFAAIVLAGGIVYSNSLYAPFILDDVPNIKNNSSIQELWPQKSVVGKRRIFGHFTFALNYRVHGFHVFGYHVTNLAIHMTGALVLFSLARRVLRLPVCAKRYGAKADTLALAIALIWLVHPLQTQAVTYIVQRLESLMALFYLSTLYLMLRGAQSNGLRSCVWYFASLVALCGGIVTKEVMVTAPLVMLLFDRIFLSENWTQLVKRRWAFYAIFAVASLSIFRAGTKFILADRVAHGQVNVEGVKAWEYACSQGMVILHYLRLAIWPGRLTLDYTWPVAKTPAEIYIPSAIVLGLLAGSLWLLWKRPPIGFLATTFFLILAPTSSFIPIADLAFEHRMYLPLAPLITLAVLGTFTALNRINATSTRHTISVAILGVVVLGMSIRTYLRNDDYNHPIRIWADALDRNPDNFRAHLCMGHLLYLSPPGSAELDSAIEHYRDAIKQQPENVLGYKGLGMALHQAGKFEEAAQAYRAGLKWVPRHAETHRNLALTLRILENDEEAEKHFLAAIKSNDRFTRAYSGYATLLMDLGRLEEAVTQLKKATQISPHYAQAYGKLGVALDRQNRCQEALIAFDQAFKKLPADSPSRNRTLDHIAWIYATAPDASVRNAPKAIEMATGALRATGNNNFKALDILAAALAESGRFDDSVKYAERAVAAARTQKAPQADGIAERLQLYRAKQTYKRPPYKGKGKTGRGIE